MIALPDDLLKRIPQPGRVFVAKDKLAISTVGSGLVSDGFDDATMSCGCVIGTDTIDRVGDEVPAAAYVLDNFRKSCSVFFNHASEWLPLPIGKAEDRNGNFTVVVESHRVLSRTYFAQSIPEGQQFWINEDCPLHGMSAYLRQRRQSVRRVDDPFVGSRDT